MNSDRMIAYIDHIAWYVEHQSILVMDLLSSHIAGRVRQHIASKKTVTGENLLIPLYMPAKTAFLISPLDMGSIGAFKSNFHTLDRTSLDLKLRAVHEAWDAVSNEALRNICINCGVVGEESIDSLRQRFLKEVGHLLPEEMQAYLDIYDAWESGAVNVEGATRGRRVTLKTPMQLPEGNLDGVYWSRFGHACTRS
jgi:hypothetical protein